MTLSDQITGLQKRAKLTCKPVFEGSSLSMLFATVPSGTMSLSCLHSSLCPAISLRSGRHILFYQDRHIRVDLRWTSGSTSSFSFIQDLEVKRMSVSVHSQFRTEPREKQILTELPLSSRYCAVCIWWAISFNPFDNSINFDYYRQHLDEETKAQRGKDTHSRLPSRQSECLVCSLRKPQQFHVYSTGYCLSFF